MMLLMIFSLPAIELTKVKITFYCNLKNDNMRLKLSTMLLNFALQNAAEGDL